RDLPPPVGLPCVPSDSDAPMDERMTTEPTSRAASMAALLPLVRYGRRYLGRAIAALAALTVSSAATLGVPFAHHSMIDFCLSKGSGGCVVADVGRNVFAHL